MAQALRWLVVLASSVGAWFATLFVGMVAVAVLDSLCPPDLVISGMCTARWYEPAFTALVLVFSCIAASLVVVVPAALAPSRRYSVALVAFFGGAAVATYFLTLDHSLWQEYLAAAVGGAGALLLATSWWRGSPIAA